MLYVGILIFIAVFYCIITEKIPNAWATMAGGLLMTMIGIINQEEVLETVYNRLEILFFTCRNDDDSSSCFRNWSVPVVCN